MASHSQLKYGARLINSYLGNNATISCCEVLNSLIFPAHEQHHNNSFLCAALVMGQSNMAAGATIGSNHNSRSPDGEIIAGRGFWPGLCVSLKHNSRFASFSILAKGDYPTELDIPLPFSLISNDASKDELVVMPAYWFLHNMYALARNSWKYPDRDKRIDKTQLLEFDFMAPDTAGEILEALPLLQRFTAKAWLRQTARSKKHSDDELLRLGRQLLEGPAETVDQLEILAEGFENGDRKARLVKVHQAYHLFKELITWYAATRLPIHIRENNITSFEALLETLPSNLTVARWVNAGGQLIRESELQRLIQQIKGGKVKDWRQVHQFYTTQGENYSRDKLQHALAALKQVHGIHLRKDGKTALKEVLLQGVATKEWMTAGIYASRAKDYTNPFRQMVYSSKEEMNVVVGSLQDNSFIRQEKLALKNYKKETEAIIQKFKL
jgi:hypothetical protein